MKTSSILVFATFTAIVSASESETYFTNYETDYSESSCIAPAPLDLPAGTCDLVSPEDDEVPVVNPCPPVTAMPINLLNGKPMEYTIDMELALPDDVIRWSRYYNPVDSEDPWFGDMIFSGVEAGRVILPGTGFNSWLKYFDTGDSVDDLWKGGSNHTFPYVVVYNRPNTPQPRGKKEAPFQNKDVDPNFVYTTDSNAPVNGVKEYEGTNVLNGAKLTYTDVNDNGVYDSGDEWTMLWPYGQYATFNWEGYLLTYSKGNASSREYVYGPSGRLSKINFITDGYVHHIMTLNTNASHINEVAIYAGADTTNGIKIAEVTYTYHTGAEGTDCGQTGDLLLVETSNITTVKDINDDYIFDSKITYYRYHTDSGLLKSIFNPEAANDLDYIVENDPVTYPNYYDIPDTVANSYADYQFQYSDPGFSNPDTEHALMISSETVRAGCSSCGGGGSVDGGTYLLSWFDAQSDVGSKYWSVNEANEFSWEAKITRPDGNIEWYLIGNHDPDNSIYGGSQLKRKVIEEKSYASEINQYYQYDWTYDVNNRVTSVRRPDGTKTVYTYYATPSDANLLKNITLTDDSNTMTQVEYEYDTSSPYYITKITNYMSIAESSEMNYTRTSVGTGTQIDTILPAVPNTENGDNTTATTSIWKNKYNDVVYVKNTDGRVDYFEYEYPASAGDAKTGKLVYHVIDLNTNSPPKFLSDPLPSGFVNTDGSNIITIYELDLLGRVRKMTEPSGIESYYVYKFNSTDKIYEYRVHRALNTANIEPASISKYDMEGNLVESCEIDAEYSFSLETGYPTGTDDPATNLSNLISLSVRTYDSAGGLTSIRLYDDITGNSYSEVFHGSNKNGKADRIVDGEGSITRSIYDSMDRVREVYIGTDDTPDTGEWPTQTIGTDLVMTTKYVYGQDTNTIPHKAGYLDTTYTYLDDNPTSREMHYEYDWRGQKLGAFGESAAGLKDYAEGWTYNFFGQMLTNDRYSTYTEINGNYSLDSDDKLLSHEYYYDSRSRIWKQVLSTPGGYLGVVSGGVPPGAPPLPDDITTYNWFNDRDQIVKKQTVGDQANLPATKYLYDSAGRVLKQYITDAQGDAATGQSGTLDDAKSVSDDTVLEQVEYTFWDSTGLYPGYLQMRTDYSRDHNIATAGELSSVLARPGYTHFYYDNAGRQTYVATYGTNGAAETAPTYNVNPPPSSVSIVLVTQKIYDDNTGMANRIIYPDGTITQYETNDAGMLTYEVENLNSWDGTPSSIGGPGGDQDRVTAYTYNKNGMVKTITAYRSPTDSEVTTYEYGITKADSPGASKYNSNSTLREIQYPDSSGSSDVIRLAYDASGAVIWSQDQRGVVHEFEHDGLGRFTADKVTSLPTGVDGRVRRVENTYNALGLVELTTSRQGVLPNDTVDNEIKHTYNTFGQLVQEWQDHDSAITDNTSLNVFYNHGNGRNYVGRINSVTYPNGQTKIDYSYGTGLDNSISRIDKIKSNSATIVDYNYLGLSTTVGVTYNQPNMVLDYRRGSDPGSGKYKSWDRFGQITLQNWLHDVGGNGTSLIDMINISHSYDLASNRLTRNEMVKLPNTVKRDELYTYDGLDRLTNVERGILDALNQIPAVDYAQNEAWNLDLTGNWDLYKFDGDGDSAYSSSADQNDTRIHNINTGGAANETTSWDPFPANSQNNPVTPVYDDAGNLIDDGDELQFVYDAWNHMTSAKRKSGGSYIVLKTYRYDGKGRRISKVNITMSSIEHEYYTSGWQRIEVRRGMNQESSANDSEIFVYGLRNIDDIVLRQRDTTSNGTLNETRYYLTDANSNVVMLVADNSYGIERVFYNTYGEPECYPFGDVDGDYDVDSADQTYLISTMKDNQGAYNLFGDFDLDGDVDQTDVNLFSYYSGTLGGAGVLSSNSTANDIGYAGYIWNDERSQWHARNRELWPKLGRWMQRDLNTYIDGLNLYVYATSQPVFKIDSMGLASLAHPAGAIQMLILQLEAAGKTTYAIVTALCAAGFSASMIAEAMGVHIDSIPCAKPGTDTDGPRRKPKRDKPDRPDRPDRPDPRPKSRPRPHRQTPRTTPDFPKPMPHNPKPLPFPYPLLPYQDDCPDYTRPLRDPFPMPKPIIPHDIPTPQDSPHDDPHRCEEFYMNCMMNPWQPDWNTDFGPKKDCDSCRRECKRNGGWPIYKCPPSWLHDPFGGG